MTAIGAAIVAVAVLGAVVLPAAVPAASAQDAVQPPPGMTTHQDPNGLVSIQLPRGSTDVGPDKRDPFVLQRWGLNWNEGGGDPWGFVYLKHVPAFARAPLCGYVRGSSRNGDRIDSTITMGKTDYWETRNYEGKGFMRFRVIEHKGQCYEAYIHADTRTFENSAGQLDLILASMQGIAEPPPPTLPTGFKQSEIDGVIVWSNAKKKRDLQRVVKMHAKAWKSMEAGLPGERFVKTKPMLIVCADDASFDVRWRSKGGTPKFCFNDIATSAVVVNLGKRRDPDFDDAVFRASCLQYSRAFFGGLTPAWMEDGLRMYGTQGVIANGKFDSPFKNTIKTAREAAARRNATLEDVFAFGKADPVDRNSRDSELYAWHWFFRHGPGRKSYGDLYDRHLAILRDTGNVLKAREVWKNANMDDMREQFQAWIAKWR